jgi:hypothetical protein
MNRREFFNWLYEYCEEGQVETRALPKKKQAFHDRGDWASIDKFCKAHSQQNLFYAVGTRNGGGTKDHIAEIPAVWADMDFKDYPDEITAKKIIYECSLRPSLLLETGGGYHAYWRFKEPAVKDEIPAVERILRGVAHQLGADNSATDASRILRIPETTNHKYEHKPAVKVIWDNRDLEYNLQDFQDLPPLTNLLYKLERVGVCGDSEGDFEGKKRDKAGQSVTERDKSPAINFTPGNHDSTLFKIAWHLAKGYLPQEETQQVIEYIAGKLDPDAETKRWATEKVRSAYNRLERREGNLSDEIREWISVTSGDISVTECDKELEIVTKRDKSNRRKILQRLVKEGLIKRIENRVGIFRVIENTCEEINFLTAPTEEINLSLPLGLSDHFKAYRKNIIVFTGDQDAGKTALLLNIIKDNMHKHEIHYFSSEMAETEMRTRLELFSGLSLQDWNFKAHERSDNFADVIEPDAINIIDYLEIDDAFYQVSGKLRAIHDKLNNGIAIIALQKSPGQEIGRGGSFSVEKPRLYVSISNDYPGHTAKIVKCKNWRTSENPNGLTRHFKLYQGHSIVETTNWERNEE